MRGNEQETVWRPLAAKLIRETFRQQHIRTEENEFAAQLLQYFIDHMDSSLSLSDAAAHAGRNKDYYGRLCRQKTGVGYHDLATLTRIAAAKALLRETTQTVEAISRRLDYSSADYFGRVFKRWTGMTPGQFRSKERKNS